MVIETLDELEVDKRYVNGNGAEFVVFQKEQFTELREFCCNLEEIECCNNYDEVTSEIDTYKEDEFAVIEYDDDGTIWLVHESHLVDLEAEAKVLFNYGGIAITDDTVDETMREDVGKDYYKEELKDYNNIN